MNRRSWLFVPGDSERKMSKAAGLDADVLILDLEDAVAPVRRGPARGLVSEYLKSQARAEGPELWVRINPIDTPDAARDLEAVMPGRPRGIVLPKPDSPAAVAELDRRIADLEAREGMEAGKLEIVAVATETPKSMFTIGDYPGCSDRLAGLAWGAEDLSAALGASEKRQPSGEWKFTYQLARSGCLLAAHAAGVQAIDTLHADFRDSEGLGASAAEARRDGFSGKIAIHPAQVAVINEAFTPTDEEVAYARRVVDAFARAGGAGTVSLGGEMLDMPHLKSAKRILGR